ncbi:tyrosine-type recombinase/integrase [Tsuneonella dongtanensis]|uniref:tyrosine-type recombinase/integrase n=1 Tax=Tsuneonella dongtanensis TaxID=692370 RepID=UPI0018DDEFA2|nr:hypothetical protein [Tsuneonella dongtanensis]
MAIYKTGASPYWQVRVRNTRTGGYIVRSTKETSRISARKAAEEIAEEILLGVRSVEKSSTFAHYAQRFLTKAMTMAKNGERNPNYAKDLRYLLENPNWGLLRFFGDRDIREVKTRDYYEYNEWIRGIRPNITGSTRRIITAAFRNVLKEARDDGLIDALPATPRAKQKDAPRSFFPFYPLVSKEDSVYRKVLLTAKALGREGRKVRGRAITMELYDLVVFTAHSFMRPTISELYALRHSDVTVADDPRGLVLQIRDGKTGYRSARTMPGAAYVFDRIKKRYPNAEPSDFLFYPQYLNRVTAARLVQRQFKVVLEEAGLSESPAKYSMYSLRHTAICMRIINSHGKVNIFTLAKNAGTSVEQIERFYARHLPMSREMAINLQQFGSHE